ncbi:hypothetical protein BS47DRAFT_1344986 [Hydnum rufescens UP504]|uniref:Uncharacterized protein n=1 Tax=Hydnum rufescens UP504 TaxID=1448309 RepID=A0A9P6AWN7_9AGAM|nr:hypothetical protein BS47DRAFT_1344986 [Hydnum rufescens UP504]
MQYLSRITYDAVRKCFRLPETRRLIAGDSLSLDQDRNVYCIVDGLVQVYAKTSTTSGEPFHDPRLIHREREPRVA